MSDAPSSQSLPLQGVGVLVTRPRAQAAELIEAIQDQGGAAICFPVIEIVPRNETTVATEATTLPKPDIAIFVSRNAVAFGLSHGTGAANAVTGPATAEALRAAGQTVDIEPTDGYNSECLLAEPALLDVAGKQVRIIRGGDGSEGRGREILADTLRARGASVNYLSVYERRLPTISPDSLAGIETAWRDGKINTITVMSVETLKNLVTLLPECCAERMQDVRLVTPTARVIKETLARYPASRPILASGPQAANMVEAIVAAVRPDSGPAP